MTETQAGLRRSLGTVAAGAIAAASIAATTSIGVGMGALAAAVGNRGPAVLLLAFLPILGIAVAFSRLNRVEPNCGNGYTWVGTSLGPWLGFVTGWINLAGSVIYGAYAFGVTEETRGSRETARGGYLSLFVTLGLFLYCAVALQRVMSVSELVNDGPQAITLLGRKLAANPVALLPPLALLASAVSSMQAGLVPTVRGAFAMGRDRTLGRAWGKVSPRYGTPVAGTLIIAAASALIAAGSMAITALSEVVIAVADSIGLIVSLYYGITAVACAVRFRSVRGPELLPSVVLPALSGACLLGAGGYLGYQYATMSSGFAFSPSNGWFLLAVPAAIIASGFGMAAVAKWGRKSPYFGRASRPAPVTATTSA